MRKLTIYHEFNAMTDVPEIQVLAWGTRDILQIIDVNDLKAFKAAGLNPYKYADILTYTFHLHSTRTGGAVLLKGYSRTECTVEWSDNNTEELKREWDLGVEVHGGITSDGQELDITFDAEAAEAFRELENENKQLRAWKQSEMRVTLPFIEFMQSREDITAGTSIHAKAIEFIKERDELKEKLAGAERRVQIAAKELGKTLFIQDEIMKALKHQRALLVTIETTQKHGNTVNLKDNKKSLDRLIAKVEGGK